MFFCRFLQSLSISAFDISMIIIDSRNRRATRTATPSEIYA